MQQALEGKKSEKTKQKKPGISPEEDSKKFLIYYFPFLNINGELARRQLKDSYIF